MGGSKERILCCGLVCVDQVTIVKEYPKEDTDQRSLGQYKVRGGNASNNCTVLSELGFNPTFLGTFSGTKESASKGIDISLEPHAEDSSETQFILRDFARLGIHVSNCCPKYPEFGCSMSVILLNSQNGKRTIINTNSGLPELTLADFERVDLSEFDWVHLEGRRTYLPILQYLARERKVSFSVEVEKVGRGLEKFIPHADLVFISKDVAKAHGLNSKEEAVAHFVKQVRVGGAVVVPWGSSGACAAIRTINEDDMEVYSSSSYPPQKVVDTIGAGDTFIATVVGCMVKKYHLFTAVNLACQVAGVKVGIQGFEGVAKTGKLLLEKNNKIESQSG